MQMCGANILIDVKRGGGGREGRAKSNFAGCWIGIGFSTNPVILFRKQGWEKGTE